MFTEQLTLLDEDQISKSQVSLPVPGYPNRFTILGSSKNMDWTVANKAQQYGIYYEMFRQHPILRAAIEKISKYAVATGFHFESVDPEVEVSANKSTQLRRFLRRSSAKHLLRLTYKDLLIYGETFWLVEKTLLGTPIRALRLHPKYMAPRLDAEDQLIGWTYGPNLAQPHKEYDADRILHFKFDDPDSDIDGLSLLHSLQLTIASDLNAMHFNGNFFENHAQTGLIIIIKQSSGDEAKRNREWLEQNYVGTRNAHRPLLLEGDVDVKPSVNKMADMQYVDGRILNRQEIMSVMDIPPDKLNIVDDFRRPPSGQGAPSRSFQSETISPLQSIVEEEINDKLIMVVFNWDDILFKHNELDKESELDQSKIYDQYERMGVLSINQINAKLGLPKVTGGDVHFIQTAAGLVPVEMVSEVAKRLMMPPTTPGSSGALPNPISGVGTDNTGQRNPPKATPKAGPGAIK